MSSLLYSLVHASWDFTFFLTFLSKLSRTEIYKHLDIVQDTTNLILYFFFHGFLTQNSIITYIQVPNPQCSWIFNEGMAGRRLDNKEPPPIKDRKTPPKKTEKGK